MGLEGHEGEEMMTELSSLCCEENNVSVTKETLDKTEIEDSHWI